VALQPLTFLVGPNGSGKSNFVDALHFVSDGLRYSLDHAIRDRGGINEVRRRSGGHPNHFEIVLALQLSDGTSGVYGFRIGSQRQGGYEVQYERCLLRGREDKRPSFYNVEKGEVRNSSFEKAPPAAPDRLYLVNAAGYPPFRLVYEQLSRMGFYNLNPDEIRELQAPEAGEFLMRDGSNIANVLRRLARTDPQTKQHVEHMLSMVVPGVTGVDVTSFGPRETLEFRQEVAGSRHPWRFTAGNMSDGTLRATGILVALYQSAGSPASKRVPLVGIEEPESALHPAAASVLRDALKDASSLTQVVVTSHSPELLDDKDIGAESILAVVSDRGVSKIGPLDETSTSVLRDRLYTAGELLRMGQIRPDPEAPPDVQARLPGFEGQT
jgi:predicted ATPase